MAVQFTKLSVSPEVVQTTGTSETAVMSQKAVTDALAGAGGGSSGGSTPVTLTFYQRLVASTTSMPSNSETNGILNKTNYPYTTNGTITITDENYNALQNAFAQHKRVMFGVNGAYYEGSVKKIKYADNSYSFDVLCDTGGGSAHLFSVSTNKTIQLKFYRTSAKLGIDQTLETIIII